MKRCLSCLATFQSESWECPQCHWEPARREGRDHFADHIDGADESYDPVWYSELATLEARNFWFIARNRVIGWLARKYLPETARYLEIGCGTGFVLQMLQREFPNWQVTGTEAMAEGLAFAAGRLERPACLQQIDARRLPYRAEFDVAGAFDVIEHVDDDGAVLAEIHAALRPGGMVILSVPQHMFLWSRFDEVGGHCRRYKKAGIERLVEQAGFEIVRSTSFNAVLLPLMLASRLTMRDDQQSIDILDELRISGLVNALLKAALSVEFAITRLGFDWPFGGSRIIVARRIGN